MWLEENLESEREDDIGVAKIFHSFPTLFPKGFFLPGDLIHSHTVTPFDAPGKEAF